jgi:hypothetical protein
MNAPRGLVPLALLLSLAAPIAAQTGQLDQVSPTPTGATSAGFNGDAASLVWQAQVRAGLAGQLEGFTLRLTGNAGATLETRLRMAAGWTTTTPAFQATVAKATAGTEDVFVDVTGAGISVAPGQLFVIELQGTGTGTGINGSYVNPTSGPALYPEPLFLGGPGCFVDCGWRIGFQTFVLAGSGEAFCAGDGTLADHTTPCPCGNNGAAGNGCANSANANGANLSATGTPSLDDVVLAGTGMPATVSCIYLQGDALDDAVFGDGVRCTGGTLVRLRTRANVGGASTFPDSTDTVTLSQRGGVTPGSGATRYYQTYYRNSAPLFCPPETFNVTNGWRVTW